MDWKLYFNSVHATHIHSTHNVSNIGKVKECIRSSTATATTTTATRSYCLSSCVPFVRRNVNGSATLFAFPSGFILCACVCVRALIFCCYLCYPVLLPSISKIHIDEFGFCVTCILLRATFLLPLAIVYSGKGNINRAGENETDGYKRKTRHYQKQKKKWENDSIQQYDTTMSF